MVVGFLVVSFHYGELGRRDLLSFLAHSANHHQPGTSARASPPPAYGVNAVRSTNPGSASLPAGTAGMS